MATIKEDYVSFEIAKLLKEKGFNERLLTFYITDEAKKEGYFQLMAFTDDKIDNNHSDHCYLAPTLQMAMKWLREKHLILYIIYPNLESGELSFSWRIYKLEQDKKHYVEELPGIGEYYKDSDESFTTYKKAEESLIKYCLENLI